jgi:hypothetical protein
VAVFENLFPAISRTTLQRRQCRHAGGEAFDTNPDDTAAELQAVQVMLA